MKRIIFEWADNTHKKNCKTELRKVALYLVIVITHASTVSADEVQIVKVKTDCSAMVCNFMVTVKHRDENWEHYADEWRIKLPDGTVIGSRVLLHPHVNEQPFTRSLSGVKIPEGVSQVEICGHDTLHGWSDKCQAVQVEAAGLSGETTPQVHSQATYERQQNMNKDGN
jgi:hypothetical protein